MAGEEAALEGMREQQQQHGLSSIQARRRFMITDILSSVGNSIREQEKDEDDVEERKPSGGLDMRLLFPVLGGHSGHNRVDAESGEEADEDDGDDGERGECGRLLRRKPSKNCPRCGFQIGQIRAKRQNGKLTPKAPGSLKFIFPWFSVIIASHLSRRRK